MYLRAISIGYAVPDGKFDSSVHSVFRSALNLRLHGSEHLLTLIVSAEGDLPQGIRLDVPNSFSLENFRVGDLVICRDGILHFDNTALTIQLSGAWHWKCDLPALRFDPARPAVSAAWNFVWEALNRRQRLAKAEIVADELFQKSARKGVSRKAGEALRELVDAARRFDPDVSAVKALIGLGSGLTPSGDDLLVGYLAGLWCTEQNKNERLKFIASLGKKIVSLSAKTNDISRTYLYHAAQGQVSSHLANLAEALCRGDDRERLNKVAEASFRIGHTSGMDAVTGLLTGLVAWEANLIS